MLFFKFKCRNLFENVLIHVQYRYYYLFFIVQYKCTATLSVSQPMFREIPFKMSVKILNNFSAFRRYKNESFFRKKWSSKTVRRSMNILKLRTTVSHSQWIYVRDLVGQPTLSDHFTSDGTSLRPSSIPSSNPSQQRGKLPK